MKHTFLSISRIDAKSGNARAVLDIGRMHDGVKQQAYRVDKDVAFLAFDFLARVVV